MMIRNEHCIVALSALLMSCGGTGLFGEGQGHSSRQSQNENSSGEQQQSRACDSDFGTTEAAMKLESFLLATSRFVGTAAELDGSLKDACTRMAGELGVTPGTGDARAVCQPVVEKLRSEMSDLRASAHLTIAIESRPPVCEVSLDAYAQCAAACDASFDPGHAELQCEGGELRGTCSAQCTGRCAVEAHGQCSGGCEGTCSASCTGVCHGECEGTCRTRGADGQCNGACTGTCHGTCSAGCTGSCEGTCEMSAQASCSGECRGGCSVAYTEPRCTGTVRPPSVRADCRADCDARIHAEAHCTPGYTRMNVTGRVASNLEERVTHLRNAINMGYGEIMAIKLKLERLNAAASDMGASARELPRVIGDLGLGAAACVTEATAALPRASAQVTISIEVSASFSATAG